MIQKAPKAVRRRTFTGCWTCRSRRVKCDEARPQCSRCTRLGVQCEGYGIRLNWSQSRYSPRFDSTAEAGLQRSTPQQTTEKEMERVFEPPARGQCPQYRHVDLLSMPTRQKHLMQHWTNYLSTKLVLLDGPAHMCKSVMLSRALSGVLTSSNQSNADITIFHAVCAASAFNLFELSNRQAQHHEILALKHERLALMHLRHNLGQQETEPACPQYPALGMAIMACIIVDAVSGSTGHWNTHVSGGISYLKHRRLGASSSAFARDMLSLAALSQADVPEELESMFTADEDDETPDPTFGASASFFAALAAANRLLQAKRSHVDADLRHHHRRSLERTLRLALPAPEPPVLSPTSSSSSSPASCMAHAFRTALRLFHLRQLLPLPLAPAPILDDDEVQQLVAAGFAQLEAIDALPLPHRDTDTAATDVAGGCCPVMWPALVLAAEADGPDLRARVRRWWAAKAGLGFGNVRVLGALVEEVWARRTAGQPGVTWLDLVGEPGFGVLRV